MRLAELLQGVDTLNSFEDVEVKNIFSNSKGDLSDGVFVCKKGHKKDGHLFAKEASKNGAVCVICEQTQGLKNEVLVRDTSECYALICKRFFGNCCDSKTLIATTGTNGKTSVTTMIYNILKFAKVDVGLISTINAQYDDKVIELNHTTPDSYTLHSIFRDMKNCDVVCLEASSHALSQNRLCHCGFKYGIFTNLTQDHLDYHEDMEAYYCAKKTLFSQCENAIINIDDSYGKRLLKEINCNKITYSTVCPNADFYAYDIVLNEDNVSFMMAYNQIQTRVTFAIPGIYSVYNVLSCIAACCSMGLSFDTILIALKEIKTIKGRCEVVEKNDRYEVICDYAHTPDGLENILKSVKAFAKGRIVLVFGCGGDRDKGKRALMGRIASMYADFTIITSDNPRTERPRAIISDILKGIDKQKAFIVIENRSLAIRYALKTAKQNDVIILAGKGHETYQVIGDKKIYYDERKIVRKHKLNQEGRLQS